MFRIVFRIVFRERSLYGGIRVLDSLVIVFHRFVFHCLTTVFRSPMFHRFVFRLPVFHLLVFH